MTDEDTLVTTGQLAKLLGPTWTRTRVWYWLQVAGIETVETAGHTYRFVRASQVTEVLHRLREARAARRHDGHGQGGSQSR